MCTAARYYMQSLRSLGSRVSRLPDRPSEACRVSISDTNCRLLLKGDVPRGIGSDLLVSRNIIVRAKRERLPSQAETVLNPMDSAESLLARMPVSDQATKSYSDIDYLAVSAIVYCRMSGCVMHPECDLLLPCTGTPCNPTERWSQGHWLLWDSEHGCDTPKVGGSAQLCVRIHSAC